MWFCWNRSRDTKLPLLVYLHGGGFLIESTFSPTYQVHLNAVVAKAGVVAISINYWLTPKHPLPTPCEDSSIAVKWVGLHSNGPGIMLTLIRCFLVGTVLVAT